MLLNQILLSCYFCKNPYSTKEDIEAKGDTNITLHCGLRFWQTWRRRWRTVPKLPKKCALRARKTREIEACTSAQGAQKKTGKGSPLSAVTLQKIDKHATEASQKLNYAHSQWNFSEYTVQGEPWPKKMLEVNATTGNSIVLIKSIFYGMSNEWWVAWVSTVMFRIENHY